MVEINNRDEGSEGIHYSVCIRLTQETGDKSETAWRSLLKRGIHTLPLFFTMDFIIIGSYALNMKYFIGVMMIWYKVKAAASKIWEALKKLPGWTVLLLLTLLAACWYLVNLALTKKKVNSLRVRQLTIEKERHESLKQIMDEDEAQKESIEKEYESRLAELDEAKEKLMEKSSKGPAEIANAWKDFLMSRKND